MREKPCRLILELSHNCNLNCIMCGFGGQPIEKNKFFDEALFEKILAEKEFFSNISEIRLNGRGESTISPRFPEIVARVADYFPDARLSLTSNLMFSNEKIIDILNEYEIDLLISVDSANKNDYESIRKGSDYNLLIERLQEIEKGHIIFTLQKYNIDQIQSIGEFAQKHGLGFILNIIRVDDQNYKNEFNKLLNEKWGLILKQLETLHLNIPQKKLFIPDQIWGKKIPENLATTITSGSLPMCPNAREELMIAYDGTIFPCNMFNPHTLGNMIENSLEKIWNSQQRMEFVENYRDNYYCQKCEYMIHK